MKNEPTNTPSRATQSSLATPSPTAHVTSNPAYHGPAPMDLSAAQKQAERERIYQERRCGGLCTYCGMAGHFRAACPRRKRRPLPVAEATPTPRAEEEQRICILRHNATTPLPRLRHTKSGCMHMHDNACTRRACMRHINARRQVHVRCIAGCNTTCMPTA